MASFTCPHAMTWRCLLAAGEVVLRPEPYLSLQGPTWPSAFSPEKQNVHPVACVGHAVMPYVCTADLLFFTGLLDLYRKIQIHAIKQKPQQQTNKPNKKKPLSICCAGRSGKTALLIQQYCSLDKWKTGWDCDTDLREWILCQDGYTSVASSCLRHVRVYFGCRPCALFVLKDLCFNRSFSWFLPGSSFCGCSHVILIHLLKTQHSNFNGSVQVDH